MGRYYRIRQHYHRVIRDARLPLFRAGQSATVSVDSYPDVQWSGNGGWWIIETVESFNGQVQYGQGSFIQWFSSNAFGKTNYLNTPVGAVSHTEEPTVYGVEDPAAYYGSWALGESFAVCAWNSRRTPYFQAIGDPFVCR